MDRQKSVEVLKAFLKNKDTFLETEREWLVSVKARCVLSDAAFLGWSVLSRFSIIVGFDSSCK